MLSVSGMELTRFGVFTGPRLVGDAELGDAAKLAEQLGFGALLDWPAGHEDQLHDLIGVVFGQLESMALERVLFAPSKIDPPEFVHGLEMAKRVSAALVRDLDSAKQP